MQEQPHRGMVREHQQPDNDQSSEGTPHTPEEEAEEELKRQMQMCPLTLPQEEEEGFDPYSLLIPVVRLLCILMVQAGVWYTWTRMAHKSIETPLEQLLLTRSLRANHVLNSTLQLPSQSLEILISAAINLEVEDLSTPYQCDVTQSDCQDGNVTSKIVTQPCKLVSYMSGLQRANPTDFLGIGLEDGSAYYLAWDGPVAGEGELILFANRMTTSQTEQLSYTLNYSSFCVDDSTIVDSHGSYDPRVRPWYQTGFQEKSWLGYADFVTGGLLVSVVAPLYDKSRDAVLGVVFAERYLSSISASFTKFVQNNETDAVYVVGLKDGDDYLEGASSGGTSAEVNGSFMQLPAANSPVDRISSSYKYLSESFANGGTLRAMNKSTVTSIGNLFSGSPVVSSEYYSDDPTGDIEWRLTTAFSEVVFYGYIWNLMYTTAAVLSISSLLSIWDTWCDVRGIARPTIGGLVLSHGWVCAQLVTCIFGLFILWIVKMRPEVNKTISDALDDRAALLSELMTTLWRDKVRSSAVTSATYQRGALPLGDLTVAAINPMLHKHFASITQLFQSTATFAGWENDDFLSSSFPSQEIHIRHSSTGNKLLAYNTTIDISGATVTDVAIADLGHFAATTRGWYKAGRDCGRLSFGSNSSATSRWGKTCITGTYTDGLTGDKLVSLVQPFFDESFAFLGVLGVDVTTPLTGALAIAIGSLPGNDTELVLVENRGEVLAQSNGDSYRIDSSGDKATVLAVSSTMERMSELAKKLLTLYDGMVDAQNQTRFELSQTESSASCALKNSWTSTRYNPVSDKLSTWTQLLIIDRQVFFQHLDNGMSTSFSILIFGSAAIVFLGNHLRYSVPIISAPDSKVNMLAGSAEGQTAVSPTSSSVTGSKEDEPDWEDAPAQLTPGAMMPQVSDAKEDAAYNPTESATQLDGNSTIEGQVPGNAPPLDTEEMSWRLKGDDKRFRQLYKFALEKYQPTVSTLRDDPDSADCELINRAAECARFAGKGYDVHTLMLTEQFYGRDSIQGNLFWWLNGVWAQRMRALFVCLFLVDVFLPQNSTEQRVLDILALLIISCFTIAWAFYEWLELTETFNHVKWLPVLRCSTWAHVSCLSIAWVALVLQQLGIVSLLGFMRPWPILLSSKTLKSTFVVLCVCIGDISTILSFAFLSICASAISLVFLYSDRLEGTEGTTFDSFLDSFIATFIFMETGDNWTDMVFNVYRISKAGAIILFVISIFGGFFLTSMILSVFDDSYTVHTKTQSAKARAKTRLALTSSFVLATSTSNDVLSASMDDNICARTASELARSKSCQSSVDFLNEGSYSMSKNQCMALLYAMDKDRGCDEGHWGLREFIFKCVDVDESGGIELIEFEKILLLCNCCDTMSECLLLAFKSTIARAELMKADACGILACSGLSLEQQQTHQQRLAAQESILIDAQANMSLYLKHLNRSFRICGRIETSHLDGLAALLGIFHFGAMSLNVDSWVGVAFNFVYCFEVAIRIYSMRSWTVFIQDPRGHTFALKNQVTFHATAVGMVGAILTIIYRSGVDTNQPRVWRVLQLAPLLRGFVMNEPYRQIVRAFVAGINQIRPFMALFLIAFYMFSMLAYHEFDGIDIKHSNELSTQVNFSTFGDSCLVMFQIFIGATWSEPAIDGAVQQTSHAFHWFFLSYRFVVGVLFAQLMVGILIATFREVRLLEDETLMQAGEVSYIFKAGLEVFSDEERIAFIKELGIPAQLILNIRLGLRKLDADGDGGDGALSREEVSVVGGFTENEPSYGATKGTVTMQL